MSGSDEGTDDSLRWVSTGDDGPELWREIAEKIDRFLTRALRHNWILTRRHWQIARQALRIDTLGRKWSRDEQCKENFFHDFEGINLGTAFPVPATG